MHLVLCILSLHVLFLLGKPEGSLKLLTLIGLHHFTWEMKTITVGVAKVPLQYPQKDMKDQWKERFWQMLNLHQMCNWKKKSLIKILMAILLIVSFYRVACNTSSYLPFGTGLSSLEEIHHPSFDSFSLYRWRLTQKHISLSMEVYIKYHAFHPLIGPPILLKLS